MKIGQNWLFAFWPKLLNFSTRGKKAISQQIGVGFASFSFNTNNNNAKRVSSLKERYEVLGALENKPDIKTRNTKN